MIVGLVGFIGSGKGTAGDILKDIGFTPVSFAKGVKDVASEMFGWPRHLLEGDTQHSREWREVEDKFWSKEFGYSINPRKVLQLIGTEVGRHVFHEDFWVIKLKKFIESSPDQNYVITDVRFGNEMKYISENGGILIEVRRGVQPHWYPVASEANKGNNAANEFMKTTDVHESEWRWIGGPIDHTIENNGSLEDLKNKLEECLIASYGNATIREYKQGVL